MCECMRSCVSINVTVCVYVSVYDRVRESAGVIVSVRHVLAVALLSLCALRFHLFDASRPDNLHFFKLVSVHPVQLLQLLVNLAPREKRWRTRQWKGVRSGGKRGPGKEGSQRAADARP